MKSLKIMPVVGVRPQIIKAAPLLKLLSRNKKVQLELLNTGQHYDLEMSRVFFTDFSLPRPLINLKIGSGTHAEQTGAMMVGIEKAITHHRPDVVLVFGDANTALAGALAAVKVHVPIAHVESGLRSGDRDMPEEVNRILVDHCSDLLFAPTNLAVRNLFNEGISPRSVFHVGDTMVDAMLLWKRAIESSTILHKLALKREDYVVLTTHRAENVDNPRRLNQILSAIAKIRTLTVFPVHPRTRRNLHKFGLWSKFKRSDCILPIAPLDYLDMLSLMSSSKLIMTDSGGMQKEAFLLRVPCLTLRDQTEWLETVKLGANRLVGTSRSRIVKEAKRILAEKDPKKRLSRLKSPFGDGHASERIASILLQKAK